MHLGRSPGQKSTKTNALKASEIYFRDGSLLDACTDMHGAKITCDIGTGQTPFPLSLIVLNVLGYFFSLQASGSNTQF